MPDRFNHLRLALISNGLKKKVYINDIKYEIQYCSSKASRVGHK